MSATDAFFVSRTMQAMEVLTFQPSSAPQVAGVLRIHPRTARRLLNRLVHDGWATRTEGRRRTYAPTLRIVALAAQLAERSPLAQAAQPVVSRLHAATGTTVHLVVPSYRSVLCLVHASGGPETPPRLRELVPAHATAGGKVLLAHRDAWRESVLELPLEPRTSRTVVDAAALRAGAALVLERGYALEEGELTPAAWSAAVPVRDVEGAVTAALACSRTGSPGPPTGEALDGLVEHLRAGAAQITAEQLEVAPA